MKKIIGLLAITMLFAGIAPAFADDVETVGSYIANYIGKPVKVSQNGNKFSVSACGRTENIQFSQKTRGRMAATLKNADSSASLGQVCPKQAAAINRLAATCRQTVQPKPVVQQRKNLLGSYDPRQDPLLSRQHGRIGSLQGPEIAAKLGMAAIGATGYVAGQAVRRPAETFISNNVSAAANAAARASAHQSQRQLAGGGTGNGGGVIINPPTCPGGNCGGPVDPGTPDPDPTPDPGGGPVNPDTPL